MSQHVATKRLTAPDILARKGGEPIVSLTAYHAHTAAIADKYVDFLLVGDSLGMVMHGFESTLPVPLDLMIMHGRAVMRGAKRALVVVDMPFGSYEESPAQAFHNAAKVIKETQCGAIKLEGGTPHGRDHPLPHRARHSGDGPYRPHAAVHQHPGRIPHPGPHARAMGAHRGGCARRDRGRRLRVVLEAIAEPLAAKITKQIPIPTIGIGASAACDGQILVMEDMLGLSPRVPKFVKEFGKVGAAIEGAIRMYADDVRSRAFPQPENTYDMKD